MESGNAGITTDMIYPILFIPKKYTNLETNCEWTDNVYINVSITSPDREGNNNNVYNGFCNVRLVESFKLNLNRLETPESDEVDTDQMPLILSESNPSLTPHNQSRVWIDPSRSPYVYNHYDPASQEQYSIRDSGKTITVQQHNTFITQNVYNCSKSNVFNYREQSPVKDESKRYRKAQETVTNVEPNMNYNKADQFECGVFLSELPDEIMIGKQSREREEQRSNSASSENNALKQLMSSDIQSSSKQRKTILFLGHDSYSGQTIHNISYNDPMVQCAELEVNNEVEIECPMSNPTVKRYQCDKCKQMFDQISLFRQHMVSNHTYKLSHPEQEIGFLCTDCGKNFKNQSKFEIHCLGHGDPDLECSKCRKVFATKFSLRVHMKIHNRKYACDYCTKSYAIFEELKNHMGKIHEMVLCEEENCSYSGKNNVDDPAMDHPHWRKADDESVYEEVDEEVDDPERELKSELEGFDRDLVNDLESQGQTNQDWADHDMPSTSHSYQETINWAVPIPTHDQEQDSNKELCSDGCSQDLNLSFSPEPEDQPEPEVEPKVEPRERMRQADDVISKVMTNTIFLLSSKKAKTHNSRKICEVCRKPFSRIDDLKRHLIEHVIKSTLAKKPVSRTGALQITCEVCQTDTFDRVDKYKAHLREHAKLTIYKCTFCDKSFSDSSNFSKHKKIHGVAFFQCDLCHRKFNSKKMIAQHMDHHQNNSPVKCKFCGRMFHFASMLNKHVRCAHRMVNISKYRCSFCEETFNTLREKWDHEWNTHSVRKMIVDCRLCGSQYRKYTDLKKHCLIEHDMEIPSAKKLLKRRSRYASFKAGP